MPRPDNVFKRTTNRLLTALAARNAGEFLPPEAELARLLDASRTTVRRALRHAASRGLLTGGAQGWQCGRGPTAQDYFDDTQTSTRREIIEQTFMEQVQGGHLKPGERFSEADLARATDASTAAVREFLIDFSRFGLVEKRPRGGWILRGFDFAYATELADIRMLLELAAMERLATRGLSDEDRAFVADLTRRHVRLRDQIEIQYERFPALDYEMHAWIISHLTNRFAQTYLSAISIVFIYHYQWNRSDERQLNAVALDEHLAVLAALGQEDFGAAHVALRRHLTTSRAAMQRSLAPAPDTAPTWHGFAPLSR